MEGRRCSVAGRNTMCREPFDRKNCARQLADEAARRSRCLGVPSIVHDKELSLGATVTLGLPFHTS